MMTAVVAHFPSYFSHLQGSDPLIQTARGKLQSRRSKLNEKINKELRMRTGAENLFRYRSSVSPSVSLFAPFNQPICSRLSTLRPSIFSFLPVLPFNTLRLSLHSCLPAGVPTSGSRVAMLRGSKSQPAAADASSRCCRWE